jgi:hypothetical protein
MLQSIERAAEISVGRGCAFAALGTGLLFVGTMPAGLPLAFTTAGFAAMLTCGILLLKAFLTTRRPYQRTELWYMLKPEERPVPGVARNLIPSVLRVTFLRFAQQAALVAVVMFGCAVVGGVASAGVNERSGDRCPAGDCFGR